MTTDQRTAAITELMRRNPTPHQMTWAQATKRINRLVRAGNVAALADLASKA